MICTLKKIKNKFHCEKEKVVVLEKKLHRTECVSRERRMNLHKTQKVTLNVMTKKSSRYQRNEISKSAYTETFAAKNQITKEIHTLPATWFIAISFRISSVKTV